MIVWTIWLAVLLACFAVDRAEETTCNPTHHNPEAVQGTVEAAKSLIGRFPTEVAIKDRLAVMILFSRGFHPERGAGANRLNYLRCALLQFQRRIAVKTPVDIYIWVLQPSGDAGKAIEVPEWLNSTAFPRVNVIGIPSESWRVPCGLLPDSQWNLRKKFDFDYYLMGRWRLTFSLDFAQAMGYEYHMQFDDDAVVLSDVDYNIVDKLRTEKHDMAVTSDLLGEVPHITLGLAELTNFWIKINKYTVQGALFSRLNPKSLAGLSSDGWDRYYHPGYWMITRIGWWYDSLPQSYLEMILRSGKDIEARWQEQAVMNMMRLVFIPEAQVHIMHKPDIGHDRHRKENYQNWCAKQGIEAIY